MKIIFKRGMALLLTLVMILTMMPLAALTEAVDAETDETMSFQEPYSDEMDDSEWAEMTEENENPEESESLPDVSETPDEDDEWPEDPGVEDDWADWYPDDSEESEDDPFWNEDERPDEWGEGDSWEDSFVEDENPSESGLSLKDYLALYDYAYVQTKGETKVYNAPECTGEPMFTISEKDSVLLVTDYLPDNSDRVKVWFLGDDYVLFTGFTSANSLQDRILTEDDVDFYTDFLWWGYAETDNGALPVFLVAGYSAPVYAEVIQDEEWIAEDPQPDEWTQGEENAYDYEEPEIRPPAVMTTSLTGTESIRLGKEGNVISGILVQNDGSNSTSITRHWVTVNGTKYTAFCLEAPKSSTSGADGSLQVGTDAGIQWILLNVPDTTDEEYAIKQQAVWNYLGQSYSPSSLKAGSRCSLSTSELRSRLESIVASAKEAAFNSRYQLWVAYHNQYRDRYQDMAFITTAPDPTPAPTPIPTPAPTPEPMLGWIQITKTDSLTHQGLAGVVFDIYQGSARVDSMTTNASGVATSSDLTKGSYTVKERALPEGYTGSLASLDCVVYADSVTELTAENQPIQFRIKIVKTDSLTHEPLAGAEFTVTRKDTGTVAAVITTDSQGEAVTDYLCYGEYVVKESKVPAHYVGSDRMVTVNGTEHNKVYEIHAENQPTPGRIRITKTDRLDGSPISGVTFDIYQGDTLVGSMTTNESGIAVSDDLPKGNYTVKEHALPEGYTGNLVNLTCTVKSDETTDLTAENMPVQFRIKIVKADALTKAPLAGAEFSITKKDSRELVAKLTTNEQGEAISDLLRWGEYEIRETRTPEHYQESTFTTTIKGTENEKTYEIKVENEPTKGWIQIVKMDALDEHPIPGVIFDVYQDDQKITSMTTDADGIALSEPLTKGNYTVREREHPQGYTGDLFSANCTVKSDETVEFTARNMPIQFKVQILKTDQLTHEPLAGAEFQVIRKSGLPSHGQEGQGEVVATLVTNEQGEAESDLLTWGEYEIRETKVPAHFVDNHYSTMVSGTEDGKTYLIMCENEPTKGYIRMVKTDGLDNTPIAGVQFDIYYADEYGEGLAGTMTTDAHGLAVSPALRKGKYLIREHENPTGYVDELTELEATVRSDETTYLSASNMPIQGKIRIVKRDELTKEALAGAEFTVTRVSGLPSHQGSNDGEVVAVITTDAEGIAVTPLLTWGTYNIVETKVPEHFVDNAFSADVTVSVDMETYTVEVENEPTKGWIRLKKTDSLNGNPIEGIRFDIYYNDQYGEGLAGTMITDENGMAESPALRKGRYVVREHGETPGYFFVEVTLECTVKSDEVTELSAVNRPVTVRLKLYKRDKNEYAGNPLDTPGTRGDGILTGAVFQVKAAENILDRQGNVLYEKGAVVVESLKTQGDDAAVLTEELWPGVYEIVELTPPTGYQPSAKSVIVDASAAAMQSSEAVIQYDGVVTNQIMSGCYGIVKFLGDNQVHADAGIIETPEKGAVFQVYLRSAGSYEDARSFERDLLTTDKNGKTVTKLLPYGVYTIKQIKGTDGYAIKAPFDIFIRGTEDPADPPFLILNNEAILYRLKITKTDAETEKPILVSGTGFMLRDAEGSYVTQTVHYPKEQVIDTYYTDADGTVTLPEPIRYGLYFLEEVKAPDGYLLRGEALAVFVGDENAQPGETYLVDVKVENDPVMGQIVLEKRGLQLTGFEERTDGTYTWSQPIYEEGYLAGAVFEIHAAEDVIGKDGTVWFRKDELADTLVTTADDPVKSRILPLGQYYLIETEAPVGYVLSDTRYEADLVYADDKTPLVETLVTAENIFLPVELSLHKDKEIITTIENAEGIRSTLTTAPGEGFVFGIYNETDVRYSGGTLMADTLMAIGTTDTDGNLVFAGYYPHGRYAIRELAAPEGWQMDTQTFHIVLDAAQAKEAAVIRVTLPEPILNKLIQYPVTLTKLDITGQHTLPGAEIEVSNAEGKIIYRAKTDAQGNIPDIPVMPGRYTFREVYAPDGYALNEAVMTFTVDDDGSITGDTTIWDDYTRFTLLKQDTEGRVLPGVEFALIRENGSTAMTAVSDLEGRIVFEKVPFGRYHLAETKALAGYAQNEIDMEVTVDGTFINREEPIAVIVNEAMCAAIQKLNTDGEPLQGAVFGLFDSFGDQIATAVSDANGMVRFEKIPYGDFTIRELEAPAGYLLNKNPLDLFIGRDWENNEKPFATVVDQRKWISGVKVGTDGKPMAHVTFQLINASTGEIVETSVTNDRGEFSFTLFDYGFWKIVEAETPEGYKPMDDIIFSVDSSWTEPEPFVCVNIPNHYEFMKADNEGNPMAGVKFVLEDQDGNILRELVSGEDGIVHVDDLIPGIYLIREIETWDGYTVSGETIELVIDEHYVIPNYLDVLVNYPDIQTGVDFEITPMMYAGGAAVLAGAVLLIVGIAKKTKSSRK